MGNFLLMKFRLTPIAHEADVQRENLASPQCTRLKTYPSSGRHS